MKVLMTTNPGIGHLHPMIPVAQALRESGHEVAFASSASFAPRIEASGFHCFQAGIDWLESCAEDRFPELRELSLADHPAWFLEEVFADIGAQKMVPDLLALCRTWQPDLLVRNDYEFAACIVGELCGMPTATIAIELFLPAHWWKARVAEPLAYLRSLHGLAPHPRDDMFHRSLYLSSVPPSFQFPEYRLPASVHSLRPVFFDQVASEGLPEWVEQLPAQPTIYVTLGTVFNQRQDVFHAILDGLRDEPVNLIITIGAEHDPRQLGPQPANVRIEGYIPQSLLLPHCDLAITHMGFGTTLAVLSHGLPLLAVPVSASDPLRARRAVDTGSGLALKVTGYPFDDLQCPPLNAENVRKSVRQLLQNPQYQQNARRLQQEAAALPGLERAVDLLTSLTRGRAAGSA